MISYFSLLFILSKYCFFSFSLQQCEETKKSREYERTESQLLNTEKRTNDFDEYPCLDIGSNGNCRNPF